MTGSWKSIPIVAIKTAPVLRQFRRTPGLFLFSTCVKKGPQIGLPLSNHSLSAFRVRSTFNPAPVKEKSSIRQVPSAIFPMLIFRDPLDTHQCLGGVRRRKNKDTQPRSNHCDTNPDHPQTQSLYAEQQADRCQSRTSSRMSCPSFGPNHRMRLSALNHVN